VKGKLYRKKEGRTLRKHTKGLTNDEKKRRGSDRELIETHGKRRRSPNKTNKNPPVGIREEEKGYKEKGSGGGKKKIGGTVRRKKESRSRRHSRRSWRARNNTEENHPSGIEESGGVKGGKP